MYKWTVSEPHTSVFTLGVKILTLQRCCEEIIRTHWGQCKEAIMITINFVLGLPRWRQWQRTCLPMQETRVRSLGRKDPLEEGMATHSSILAWRTPTDREAWRSTIHRVTQGWTRLKRLSTYSIVSLFLSLQNFSELPKFHQDDKNLIVFLRNYSHILF